MDVDVKESEAKKDLAVKPEASNAKSENNDGTKADDKTKVKVEGDVFCLQLHEQQHFETGGKWKDYAKIRDCKFEDPDDQMESEFFDTRQQFLNLCQGNHYQFDSLRRAKHTSMMALYHIHNPDMPKFLQSCSH